MLSKLKNIFARQPEIIFQHAIPGVESVMPVIPAKELSHKWVNSLRADFAEKRKNPNWNKQHFTHTIRCPGIFGLMHQGWIVRTWQDITIETNGDGDSFKWTSVIDQTQIGKNGNIGPAVDYHRADELSSYMENWPSHSMPFVLKICTGWSCIVPKGFYLLEMPVAYSDENRFTTLPGIFSREYGPAYLNVQIMWHIKNGKVLLKAGTPLAQYVLLPVKQAKLIIQNETSDPYILHDVLSMMRFVKNYTHFKKTFGDKK